MLKAILEVFLWIIRVGVKNWPAILLPVLVLYFFRWLEPYVADPMLSGILMGASLFCGVLISFLRA